MTVLRVACAVALWFVVPPSGGLPALWPAACAGGLPADLEAAVRRAGNCPDDAERLAILKALLTRDDLPSAFRNDLGDLTKTIGEYVHSKNLTRFGRSRGFEHKIPEDSPLYPLVCFYRARTLIWHMIESGGIQAYPERRKQYVERATKLLKVARKAFPENPVLGMYLGEPIPPKKQYPGVAGAPEWATYQREALERMTDIIEWWVDHRQQPDGSYGGGLEDDCEMWRWWAPVLVAFQHPKIEQAQARLSACILRQRHMRQSYTTILTDVEHAAEWSADSITPMMHLDPDNPAWKRHALNLVRLMKARWTGRNERGFLQFQSTYFSADRVRLEPPAVACDTVYHPRAIQPALLYWLRTADKAVGDVVAAWMDTWVDAAARAERGRPAGILPSAIHWPDGRPGGLGKNWWEPGNYPTRLYDWPSAMSMMTNTLLQTYHITGNRKYLEPILSMARIRRKHIEAPAREPAAGTEAWCAQRMDGFLLPTLARYRFLTGDTQFDDLLAHRASGTVRFRLRGDLAALAQALETAAGALAVNWPGYTREVRWTDRVFVFHGSYLSHTEHPQPQVDARLLYATATGDPGGVGYFPMNAVRWLTPPRDIAALVTDSGPTRLTAQLFGFGDGLLPMAAELYLLEPGQYRFTLTPAMGPVATRAFRVAGPRTRLAFALPPRTLCVLRVRKEQRGPP